MAQTMTPCVVYREEAEEAIGLYVSLVPDSEIHGMDRYPEGSPLAGAVLTVRFRLGGVECLAINAGEGFARPTEAFSFQIDAPTQDDIDRLWDALTADGGEESQCGWLKDRFGVSWQIVPPVLGQLLSDPDPAKAQAAMQAMLGMRKLDIAALRAAHAAA